MSCASRSVSTRSSVCRDTASASGPCGSGTSAPTSSVGSSVHGLRRWVRSSDSAWRRATMPTKSSSDRPLPGSRDRRTRPPSANSDASTSWVSSRTSSRALRRASGRPWAARQRATRAWMIGTQRPTRRRVTIASPATARSRSRTSSFFASEAAERLRCGADHATSVANSGAAREVPDTGLPTAPPAACRCGGSPITFAVAPPDLTNFRTMAPGGRRGWGGSARSR